MTEEAASWASIADWYDELLEGGSGPHLTAIKCLADLCPPVEGQQIIDVACGQGIASRMLAAKGALVVGVDYAAPMIENARRHGTPAGAEIEFIVDDGQTLATIESDRFDGATCQLGLMDIPDLDATLAAIKRVLKPGGWLVFVTAHPAFLVPHAKVTELDDGTPAVTVTDYFEERFWRSTNPQGVRRAGNFHRTLSTYLNSLVAAGFAIEEAREPIANDLLAAQQPLYTRVPIFFAARVRA